jgi:hypothetical protein
LTRRSIDLEQIIMKVMDHRVTALRAGPVMTKLRCRL